jgi:4-diphosphocytidyl-2-C-methyl-D-erythritol kinase
VSEQSVDDQPAGPLGRVELRAPAKLTLTLRITGVRADGFHELEALTTSISAPADDLVLEDAPAGTVELTLTGRTDDVPGDESNLVVRAARAVLPAGAGVRIALHKRTPPGAGLGGGSADAGVVLRALRDGLGLDAGGVAQAAADLGSDIPFCLDGGPAWMRGRGERLEGVAFREPLSVLVAVPPFALHTPPVYRAWDDLGGPRSDRAVPAPHALAHLVDELANDLEPAAEHVEPRLRPFREALEAATGARALLAGSGSALWIPCADPLTAAEAAARAEEVLGVPVFLGLSL